MLKVSNFIGLIAWLKKSPRLFGHTMGFFSLLMLILLSKATQKLAGPRFIPEGIKQGLQNLAVKIYALGVRLFDTSHENSIARSNLIEMSLKNMRSKKTRTMITIGGMTIGIAAIVFLVSIGYGLQEVVISRVARLDELRQADLSPQPGSKIKINDTTLSKLKDIKNVEKALPVIAVVGQVNYKNSISDMAVYGVTSDYLNESAVKPSKGKIFESNLVAIETSKPIGQTVGEVAGTAIVNPDDNSVQFDVHPESWARVREAPSAGAKLIGYTKHVGGKLTGSEIVGSPYKIDETTSDNLWIKASVPIWQEADCSNNQSPCVDNHQPETDPQGNQVFAEGYLAEANLTVERNTGDKPAVLGLSTDDSSTEISIENLLKTFTASDSALVAIASESAVGQVKTKTTPLGPKSQKVAVINRAALQILGISESSAIGQKFSASFTVIGNLLDNPDEKIQSEPADYTIIGIIPDNKTPLFFVPFIDLRSLGVTNYSQVKVVVRNKDQLATVRKNIEGIGLGSHSVADTVLQINSLFGTVRTIMALLGMVALAVASLGMFNTLTVSLLERTREVGLMKAMGMRSDEVKELFLTESMVMSIFGGFLGLIFGFIAGKVLGIIISVVSVTRGLGVIDIAYIPLNLALAIIALSFIVGAFTGYYPARRATKISALDALRYE